ncbi:hypothetical protein CXF70_16725, partial [Planomicrobium sp. MB-3u-38]
MGEGGIGSWWGAEIGCCRLAADKSRLGADKTSLAADKCLLGADKRRPGADKLEIKQMNLEKSRFPYQNPPL